MKRLVIFMLTGIVMLVLMDCASIVKGSMQQLSINSQPDGADVIIYDQFERVVFEGETPSMANLKRGAGFFTGASYRIEMNMDGYETENVYINSSVNGWYIAGNLFIGYIIGWLIIDPLTGAMWNLTPDYVNADMENLVSDYDQGDLVIVLKQSIPDGMIDSEELVKLN